MTLPEGPRLRPARRSDRDAVYALLAEEGFVVSASEQSNTLSWVVSHPEIDAWIATDQSGRVVGFLCLMHRPSLRVGGRLGFIDALIVKAAARRSGVGTALLSRCLERAQSLGCRKVEVGGLGEAALAFLEQHGFVDEGSRLLSFESGAAGPR